VRAPIVSRVTEFSPQTDDLLLCAIGSPQSRRKVAAELEARGGRFGTFVHDSVVMGDAVTLGQGTIVCPGTVLTNDITVGEQVHINTNCNVGHDVSIGSFVTLSSACNLTGGVTIGEGTFVATAASIIPGRTIGSGAYIGVGSVVIRNVGDDVTVFGNPSRVIGRKKS
jgi:sugar O-acyltransferase (sialic acid O-acetyltransferase NeuD family)